MCQGGSVQLGASSLEALVLIGVEPEEDPPGHRASELCV